MTTITNQEFLNLLKQLSTVPLYKWKSSPYATKYNLYLEDGHYFKLQRNYPQYGQPYFDLLYDGWSISNKVKNPRDDSIGLLQSLGNSILDRKAKSRLRQEARVRKAEREEQKIRDFKERLKNNFNL